MTKNTTTINQSKTVQVNHWRYPRRVEVLPDQVALQVTVPSCSHCPTCQRRVRELTEVLERKPNVVHQWKWADGAQWIHLPRAKKQNPLQVLGEVLEVRIGV